MTVHEIKKHFLLLNANEQASLLDDLIQLQDSQPIPDWQKDILKARLDDCVENPDDQLPAQQVLDVLISQYAKQ